MGRSKRKAGSASTITDDIFDRIRDSKATCAGSFILALVRNHDQFNSKQIAYYHSGHYGKHFANPGLIKAIYDFFSASGAAITGEPRSRAWNLDFWQDDDGAFADYSLSPGGKHGKRKTNVVATNKKARLLDLMEKLEGEKLPFVLWYSWPNGEPTCRAWPETAGRDLFGSEPWRNCILNPSILSVPPTDTEAAAATPLRPRLSGTGNGPRPLRQHQQGGGDTAEDLSPVLAGPDLAAEFAPPAAKGSHQWYWGQMVNDRNAIRPTGVFNDGETMVVALPDVRKSKGITGDYYIARIPVLVRRSNSKFLNLKQHSSFRSLLYY